MIKYFFIWCGAYSGFRGLKHSVAHFMDFHCGDLTPCLLKKSTRPGISMCDLFLTYLTEHIFFFLAHYCNNRMLVNNCILEVPSSYIICVNADQLLLIIHAVALLDTLCFSRRLVLFIDTVYIGL